MIVSKHKSLLAKINSPESSLSKPILPAAQPKKKGLFGYAVTIIELIMTKSVVKDKVICVWIRLCRSGLNYKFLCENQI